MPIILCVVLGTISGFIVAYHSKKYYNRLNFFLSFDDFLSELGLNFGFLQDEIPKLIGKTYNSSHFNKIMESFKEFVKLNDCNKLKTQIGEIALIKNEEKEKIFGFFYTLGRSDLETQRNLTRTFKLYIQDKIILSKQDVDKKGTLIQKLSVIAGMFVVILLL